MMKWRVLLNVVLRLFSDLVPQAGVVPRPVRLEQHRAGEWYLRCRTITLKPACALSVNWPEQTSFCLASLGTGLLLYLCLQPRNRCLPRLGGRFPGFPRLC